MLQRRLCEKLQCEGIQVQRHMPIIFEAIIAPDPKREVLRRSQSKRLGFLSWLFRIYPPADDGIMTMFLPQKYDDVRGFEAAYDIGLADVAGPNSYVTVAITEEYWFQRVGFV